MSDYNGWKNYETWNVKLWIDTEEGDCRYWEDAARDAYRLNDDKPAAVRQLAERLENEITDAMPTHTGMYADILGNALKGVDWREIAEAMLEDYTFEETDDDDK